MKMKNILTAGCLTACTAAMMIAPALAASVTNEGSTPAYIVVDETSSNTPEGSGESALVTLSFQVSERLDFKGQKDCSLVLATKDGFVVKNTGAAGPINVDTVHLQANGWTIKKDDKAAMKNEAVNSKIIGFSFNGQDMQDNKIAWSNKLVPGASATMKNITGSIAPQSVAIKSEQEVSPVSFVATVSMVEAKEVV